MTKKIFLLLSKKTLERSPAEEIFGRKICRERWYGNKQLSKKIKEPERIYTTFDMGDEILVKGETRTKDKDRYEGPYEVVEKIHDQRYLLQQNDGKTIQRNMEKLRTFLKEWGYEY